MLEYNRVNEGDCVNLAQMLEDQSVRLVVCSPPYAMQRKKLYGGISEKEYPAWTVSWLAALWPKLSDDGSIFIVIREHIKKGVLSDYVLRTRLAIRDAGWFESETLIWHKPDAPPLGSIYRPRRNWEYILWYSKSRKPFANLKACGNAESTRVGGFAGSDRFGEGGSSPIAKNQNRKLRRGTSRCADVLTVAIGSMDKGVAHPAMFPQGIPDRLILTHSCEGDLVLDPFAGSGQTGLSALRNNRRFIGFDVFSTYCQMANERLAKF